MSVRLRCVQMLQVCRGSIGVAGDRWLYSGLEAAGATGPWNSVVVGVVVVLGRLSTEAGTD